jgi:PAS domain S-box-containing protein
MDTPLRILILEDNSLDARLIEFEIEEAGIAFHSKVVASKQDFIKSIQDFPPDIILSDYDLRIYTGADALKEANRLCPDVPFILVTGAVTEDRAIDILTGGAKDFVMKHRLKKLGPSIKRAVAEAEEHKARKKAEQELRNAKENLEVLVEERTRQLNEELNERKLIEKALRQSEFRERERAEELAAILDAAPMPIFIAHDQDCHHITGNRAADELLRNPRGGEASLSASNDRRPGHFKALKDGRELSTDELPAQRAARGFEVRNFDCSFVFADGTTRDVVAYGTPLLDADGSSRGSIVVFVDITERKRHEEILQKAKNELYVRSLIEASLDPLVTISPDGKITDVNEATEHVTGRKRHDLIGTDFSDYFTDPDAARAGYRKVLSDGQVRDYPLTISDASGKRTDVLYHATAYRNPQGEVQGVFAAARDVTARKRMEEAVKAKRQRRIKRNAGTNHR